MGIRDIFDPVFSVRLLETLCHFLWQGAAVALVLAAAWPLLRRAAAATRYRVFVAGLLVMAACPVVTFFIVSGRNASAPGALPVAAPRESAPEGSLADRAG